MSIRDLDWGMSGPDVKAIQEALDLQPGLKSPRLDHNGVFGPKTDAKVREFQALKHIPVTGRVGTLTRRALFPVGVATVTIVGTRQPSLATDRYPNVMPGKLTPPSAFDQPLTDRYPRVMPGRLTPPSRDKPVDLDAVKRHVDNAVGVQDGAMVKIPGAPQPLFARILPDHILGFDYDHMELVPGGQVTLPGVNQHLRSHQDAFSLTLQSIYQRGPDDGPNKTLTLGTNFTVPEVWLGGDPGPWTLAPFIQLTDVDRFWHVGNWHFWQPYAQVGAQFNLSRPVQPSATGALFPVNIGYDLNDSVTFQFASGLTFALDVSSGQFTAARQATFGVSIKFGKPKK